VRDVRAQPDSRTMQESRRTLPQEVQSVRWVHSDANRSPPVFPQPSHCAFTVTRGTGTGTGAGPRAVLFPCSGSPDKGKVAFCAELPRARSGCWYAIVGVLLLVALGRGAKKPVLGPGSLPSLLCPLSSVSLEE